MHTKRYIAVFLAMVVFTGCSEPETIVPFAVGDRAPELNLTFLQGEPISLTKTRGDRVHIIEFWATWCPPCKESAPYLSQLQENYGEQGLTVLGISDEDETVVKPYLAQYGSDMAYTVALDPEGATQKKYLEGYGIEGIPWAFLLDRAGNVAWVGHPMAPELETELKKLLDATDD